MSVRSQLYFGVALACVTIGQLALAADEPARGRPSPIIFSAPKSDTVSSNLNQIGTKSSPLLDLESGLKQPFEIFDSGRSSGAYQPPNRFAPPASSGPVNNKKLKEVLDKRAEESYLLSDENQPDGSRDELMNRDDSVDPISGRPKTSLDRYYDRIDRMKAGPTNQTPRSIDLFGAKDGLEEKDDSKVRKSGGLFDRELSANARVLGQMSNSISEGGRLSSDKLKARSFGDIFELGPVETGEQAARTKETRLDEFKRLLEGPGYGARSEFNVAPPPSSSTAYQPPKSIVGAPSSGLSFGSQPAGGSFAGTPGFSGAVGVPVGVPEFAASSSSLTPSPVVQPPAQKPPVPTFQVPRRRF